MINLQKSLDKKILKEKELKLETTIDKRFLALLVELSEFSNELRCFKYWSNKSTYKSFEKMLDEYIDCIHFIISIGLCFNIDLENYVFKHQEEQDLTLLILKTMNYVLNFWNEKTKNYFIMILDNFFTISFLLNIDFSIIYNAYLKKNDINFERIQNNY